MPKKGTTYRRKISIWLAVLLLALNTSYATSDQTLSGLTKVSLGAGLGDTTPAVAFNSKTNEYLVVYAKTDADCGNKRLFATIIDGISGALTGNAIPISDCNISIEIPEVIYNVDQDEYLILYKSVGTIGNKSSLFYCTLDGTTNSLDSPPIQLDGDAIADPFRGLTVGYDQTAGVYALGYHKGNALGESALTVKYLSASTHTIKSYDTMIGKTNFSAANSGAFGTKILFNGTGLTAIFELKLTSGSEIWGGIINAQNGTINGDYFQISPDGQASKFYTNPDAYFNAESNEIVTVYEESYFSDAGGAYTLSENINLQKINAPTGQLSGPSNVAIPPLPGTGNTEDKKLPTVSVSELSKEVVLSYYGIRFAAGTDTYNLYIHRMNLGDLTSIAPSTSVATSVGKQVLENEGSKRIRLTRNAKNNQFHLAWMAESTKELQSQIWKYNNNPPSNLQISKTAQNENRPAGTVFATLSADDPDPEDASPNFTLVEGIGGEDNAFFSIVNNELRIAQNLNYEEGSTRSVKIRATDSHGAFTDKIFTLTVIDINEAPDNISLSAPLLLEENVDNFTSTITVEDEDFGDTHTLTLIAGDSSDNNSNFEILVGNILSLKTPVNFEDTSRLYVRIKATDVIGLSKEKAFAIEVVDVNEPMDTMYISPQSIPENDPGAFVSIEIVDPDKIQDYIITLTAGDGDDDNASFRSVDNKLQVITPFNFEIKNTYKVLVKAKEGNYAVDQALIISVNDVNDTPDSITISSRQIMDGRGAGFAIGKIFTYDQDEGDEHKLSLTEGADIFSIDTNDSLLTKIPLVYNYSNSLANFYNITIRSEDQGGSAISKSLSIEVIPFSDKELPKILNFEDNDQFIVSDIQKDFSLSIDATDNEKLDTVLFYYRQIRSNQPFAGYEGTLVTKNNEKFYSVEAQLNTSVMDEMGIEYYFKVVDAAGNADSTNVGYTYKMYNSRIFEPTGKSYEGDFTSYKIISNPFNLGSNSKVSKIFSDYGSSSDKTWRLFKYDGIENVEIGKSTSATIVQGVGYWFNKMPLLEQAIVLDNAQVPENNRENEFSLNLAKGWNLIGNPYPFPINWNEVRNHNGLTSNDIVLYTFNGEYQEANALDEFEGAYVYSEIATEIDIPIVNGFQSGRIASEEQSEYEWTVNFSLENKRLKNRLSGIGMHSEASFTYDNFDRPLPPRFITYGDIAFSHPEHSLEEFSRDIAPIAEQHIWNFVTSSNSLEKDFKLSWSKPVFDSPDKRLVLYDINNDIVIDMLRRSSYDVNLGQSVAFKAIYGTQSFIDSILSVIHISSSNPYPNPFSTEVFLPLSLPNSNNDYSIECSIFNLLGERVFMMSEDNISGGPYMVTWEDKQQLQKGIYIYSIKVKNMFLAKEFHGRIVKN